MAYLYLNFVDNLDKGLGDKFWGRSDFFTQSLNDQYESLKRKLGGYAPESLREFIEYMFPTDSLKYYNISLPSFERTMDENKRGNKILRNIVIRPEADRFTESVLPKTYDFIAIGDVTFGSVTEISVKGIDFIDKRTVKFGEKRLFCCALSAFAKKEIYNRYSGNVNSVPDYGSGELHDSVLTNDVVNEVATRLYPVQKPYEVIQTFEKWRKYIDFRRYYLGKQSERCEAITGVSVCDAYMITRETYRRNEETFSELLLDGVKEFCKGEQIVLSKGVAGADGFPLICVTIEKNRKEVLSETVGRNGKGKPKFEVGLNRYTRDAMGLSPYPPKSDDKGNVRSIKTYLLGERYLFTYFDIEPDLSALEKRYEKELAVAHTAIDNKYNGIILSELNRYIEKITPAITAKYDKILAEYTKDLEERLDSDVRDNSDKETAKVYQYELNKRLAPIEIEKKQKHKSVQAEIDKIKQSKLSQQEDERLEALRVREVEVEAEYAERTAKIKEELSLRDFYIRRNISLTDKKQKSLAIKNQEEIENCRKEKKQQLETQYKADIATDKKVAQEQLRWQFDVAKEVKIENETIRCYRIYFRPEDATDKVSEIKKQINALEPKYLTYDNRAEKAKIDRQEKALNSILDGYVKNPFLPTYIFSPEALTQSTVTEEKDPEWCLESLNDRQKLAVKRALQSESIFLLQGPPGTGKTQVIAEITAQLTKRGKKVLISSETHKAIDNVFDRLPKIPEIRPLRLIPSQNGKETNYSPEKLVDNFYLNICGNLEKQIARFDHFEETKTEFDDTMKSLRHDYDCILKLKRENAKIDKKRNDLLLEINRLNDESESLRERLLSAKEATERYNRTLRYVESYRFFGDSADEECLKNYADKVENLLKCFSCFEDVPLDKVGELVGVDIQTINEELSHLLSEDTLVELKNKQKQLRAVLSALRDPETDEAPEEGDDNYAEYKKNQNELILVGKRIKEYENNTDFDISDSKIYTLLPGIAQSKELLKQLPKEIMQFKTKLAEIVNSQKDMLYKEKNSCSDTENSIQSKVIDRKIQISDKKREYEELGENSGIEEYSELNSKLKQRITRFFRDFGIIKEYDADNLETAFDIIKEEWKKLESEYNSSSAANMVKIPMYKDIVKYLSQEDILEEDRTAYTRELYNSANVFGITCTSRDRFTPSQLSELGKYGIDSVDIRTQGIDVVIVDEVSKSSFLDLLIPILYGKTVILVGDHRQLPPMYDLRHMRGDDFDGLDEEIITKELNDEYTKIYEECFFKTLYEKVPDDFHIMLNKQYRCHSHIMEVFNHFYGGNGKGLVVGKKQQDDEKEHGLTVKVDGNTIIDPKRHIYFVDCDQKESSAFEGSTSKINEQEAQVAITLLKELDKSAKELVSEHKIIVDSSRKIDERPSAGIICTYGDQAGLIKKKRKSYRFDGFSGKQDEKLVISTVDDFQGDERDIIIVSMVRNPSGNRYDAEFIKKFERINVALSRARKLLIIIGSKKFLSEAGVIDLPDLEGNKSLDRVNYPVYREIIDTINFRGRILTAKDVLGE